MKANEHGRRLAFETRGPEGRVCRVVESSPAFFARALRAYKLLGVGTYTDISTSEAR